MLKLLTVHFMKDISLEMQEKTRYLLNFFLVTLFHLQKIV
jgi:hypothetical protein